METEAQRSTVIASYWFGSPRYESTFLTPSLLDATGKQAFCYYGSPPQAHCCIRCFFSETPCPLQISVNIVSKCRQFIPHYIILWSLHTMTVLADMNVNSNLIGAQRRTDVFIVLFSLVCGWTTVESASSHLKYFRLSASRSIVRSLCMWDAQGHVSVSFILCIS